MKKTKWRIKDLIDLEYFLRKDESDEDTPDRTSLSERDRDIYLNRIRPPEQTGDDLAAGGIIRAWLEQRRAMEKSETGRKRILPGEAFGEIYGLLEYGFLITGLMVGAGLAFSYLSYKGTEPLNISAYLGGFILVQILLLLLLLVMAVVRVSMRSSRRSTLGSSVVYNLIGGLITALTKRIKRSGLKTLKGSERDGLEAVFGLIRGKRKIYGSLFYWPLYILAQIFGVGFNLGLLSATFLKVLGADIAFGWQSTVQFSAGAVHELVRVIALPWSWFVPIDIAYPGLLQIEGSHMVLKDGIYHLATEDLVSWWPFLCLAVLFYGLLPRLVLLLAGLVVQKRALDRIDFGHAVCERLLSRMRTPRVNMDGYPEDAEFSEDAEHPRMNETPVIEAVPSDQRSDLKERGLIALIPDEIFDSCADEELEMIISQVIGYPITRKFRIGADEELDRGILEELSKMKMEKASPNVLILQEAWQPPIVESLRFIKDLRRILDKSSLIKVGLIGRPRPDSLFTRVKEEEWKVWHQKMKTLGDPYLGLERLMVNDGK